MLQSIRFLFHVVEEIMLKSLLIYLSKASWAQKIVTNWKFAKKAASRFVAGSTIGDALMVVKGLNERGINATIDHLGESTTNQEDAIRATNEIITVLNEIGCCDVRANVSIKLTQIGLSVDQSLCLSNLFAILQCAKKNNNYIRIDMEDTPYTDNTIYLYKLVKREGFDNLGLVIQSYLFRSEADINDLLEERTHFRLVKGAYKEPASVAFPKKRDVDENFDRLTKLMLDSSSEKHFPELSKDGRTPPLPAIGTHDPQRIIFAKRYAEKIGLSKQALEFQMLYGIRRDLQDLCLQEGYPVRIYVPYGTHWYPFYMRRLAERPANLLFFIGNYFKK
jgi:proline dehydrogenase